MKLSNYIVLVILMCCSHLNGQVADSLKNDVDSSDTTLIKRDTIPFTIPIDTTRNDTLTVDSSTSVSDISSGVKISNDGLDDVIDYGSKDSSYIDLKTNQIHLFGEAFVKYKQFDLKAGYIIFDFEKNEASAFRLENEYGVLTQKPDFTDGTNKFLSNGLRFNFKSNKGLIYDAITNEGEFTIHGKKTKFVSKDADSTAVDDQIYNQNALITTCTEDHYHYGFRTRKLKVIPNKLAIIGLSQLEIMGIPTPLILPFGFFPLVEGRSSGLIFPSNYEYNEQLGLGFREIGYYFPLNDYIDLRITGDIYTRGSHRLNIRSQYKKRYKYSGNIQLSYANTFGESSIDGSRTSNKSYSLKVTHNQDAKAHPYQNIGGTINISTNRFDQTNSVEYENVVNNKIRSNFFYKHTMPGTPFSFSTAFTHNQDNSTRKIDITLPDAQLRMNTIYPFKSNKGGKESWYEKVNVGYNAKFKNYVSATDTTLFTDETLENLQTGLSHNANTGASFNVLKYFNVTTSANFEQFVFTRTQVLKDTFSVDTIGYEVDQLRDSIAIIDTTFGISNQFFENGLASLEKFNMSVNLTTQLFATKRFSKGWLRGLRHTMKPSFGFTYSPDTKNKYEQPVMVTYDLDEDEEVDTYNPFRGGAFNPSLSTKQMAMTYRITNLFEGKYFSKADSTEKKFKLLNNLNISGSYNFAADSIKWSPMMISGNTSLFKGITNINFSARYNFYAKDEDGNLTGTTVWSQKRRPLEFDNFNLRITNGFSLGKIRELFQGTSEPGINNPDNNTKRETSLGDWIDGFRFDHSIDYILRREDDGRDTSYVRSHSIKLSGRVQLTDSWNLSINNISYDLLNKAFVYPQFSLSRDLHCWTMQFTWTPSLEVYSFYIGVKSNSLSFLKYNYGQRNASQLSGFPR